jgi:hypothetical protein
MTMPEVTVKVMIGGFSVEVAGPQEYVDQKIGELVERFLPPQLRSPSAPEAGSTSALLTADAAGKALSPAEFLRKISHTNQLDRALALGYYLEKMRNVQSFTTKELLELSKEVKYPFANISESVSRLVGRGLMMTAGDKEGARAYSITATGEQMIDSMPAKV